MLRAALATLIVVIAALCIVLMVLAADWLISNFNIDRLLAITGIVISVAAFLFALIIHFRRRP